MTSPVVVVMTELLSAVPSSLECPTTRAWRLWQKLIVQLTGGELQDLWRQPRGLQAAHCLGRCAAAEA